MQGLTLLLTLLCATFADTFADNFVCHLYAAAWGVLVIVALPPPTHA